MRRLGIGRFVARAVVVVGLIVGASVGVLGGVFVGILTVGAAHVSPGVFPNVPEPVRGAILLLCAVLGIVSAPLLFWRIGLRRIWE
jgi:hypothetical protein